MADDILTDDDLRLVEELAKVLDQQARLEQQAAEIKAELRQALDAGRTYTDGAGNARVRVTPNLRFNREHAAEILPESLLPLVTVQVIDSATARKNLPPAMYRKCMVEVGEPVVKLL